MCNVCVCARGLQTGRASSHRSGADYSPTERAASARPAAALRPTVCFARLKAAFGGIFAYFRLRTRRRLYTRNSLRTTIAAIRSPILGFEVARFRLLPHFCSHTTAMRARTLATTTIQTKKILPYAHHQKSKPRLSRCKKREKTSTPLAIAAAPHFCLPAAKRSFLFVVRFKGAKNSSYYKTKQKASANAARQENDRLFAAVCVNPS